MMISKISPSCNDYKMELMHQCEDMPPDILMHHLKVKELSRNKEKKIEQSGKEIVKEAKPKGRFTPNKREFKSSIKGK